MKKLIVGFCSMLILLAFLAQVGATTYSFPSVQCVSDESFDIESDGDFCKFWELTHSDGADDYHVWEDSVNGYLHLMCNESTGDEWGDALAYQGWIVHADHNNRAMRSHPYFPVSDLDEDKLLLKVKLRHDAPTFTSISEWAFKAQCPSAGATVMVFFNVWINDTGTAVYHQNPLGEHWLFNYTDEDEWNEHNTFIAEIFFTRFEYTILDSVWHSVPANSWDYNYFTDLTTHDNDLHQIILNTSMPNNNQWYEFEYDLGNLLDVDVNGEINEHYWNHGRDVDVLGYQIMGIGIGNEVISAKWETDWDYVRLYDNRNLTRNSEEYGFSAKTKWQEGKYYRPSYAHDWNGTYNMTSFKVVKYSHTNSSCDGDANYDGVVDIFDTTTISTKYGKNEGDSGWDYKADINPDRTIDIYDIVLVSAHWSQYVSWTDCSDSNNDIWVKTLFNASLYYVTGQARLWGDHLFDFMCTVNGSHSLGDSGMGSFEFYHDCSYGNGGTLSDPIVVVIKFFPNKNPDGVANGPRLWSALHETDYPYS